MCTSWPVPLLHLDLHTPVPLAAFGRGVGVHRTGKTVAGPGEAGRIDTLVHEVVEHGAGAVLGESLVVGRGGVAVGVAFDDATGFRMGLEPGDDAIQIREEFPLDDVGVVVEQGEGADGFQFSRLRRCHIDGILDHFLHDLLDNFLHDHRIPDDRREGRNDDRLLRLRFAPLAEAEGKAHGAAQGHGQVMRAGIVRLAVESGRLQVRDDGQMPGQVNRKHHTRTAAETGIDNLQIAPVHIGDNIAMGTQEHVAMEILELAVAEIGITVGDAEALVAGTKADGTVEPAAEVKVTCITGTVMGSGTITELESVEAEVHACAGTDEVSCLPLGKRRKGNNAQEKGQKCLFHGCRCLEMIDDAEGEPAPKIQRKAGIALVSFLVLLGRHQTVILVVESLTTQVGKETETGRIVVFSDEAAPEPGNDVLLGHLLPRVLRIGEAESISPAHTRIQFRTESRHSSGQSVQVDENVGESRHMTEGVRIESVSGRLACITGTGIITECRLKPGPVLVIEIIAEGYCTFKSEQIQ